MKKFFHISFLGLNILFLIPFILSIISLYISPKHIWFLPFFGLSFIFWFFVQLIFFIIWAFRRRWHALISLTAILFSWNQITAYFQFHSKTPEPAGISGSFKVITYNVRLFNLYNWNQNKVDAGNIVSFINKQDANIICLQEFLSSNKKKAETFDTLSQEKIKFHTHFRYTFRTWRKQYYGLAIFSKFPIIHRGEISFPDSKNQCIYADLKIGNDTFRLYNVHLQSVYFSTTNYNFLDSFEFRYDERNLKGSLEILRLMKNGYRKRANQVSLINQNIRECPYPVIVCGDFNDTPVSYAYHSIKSENDLIDGFHESGSGFGSTYSGLWPNFRIDYILYDKELKSANFTREKIHYSDHFPIQCYLFPRPESK